jgi:AcrR family transcriptional regulator
VHKGLERKNLAEAESEPTMTGAYAKAEVRRSQLVAAARAVLAREGMAGTTLRGVAAEAGVPLGTVHYIFATKEQLLRAVLEDVLEEISVAFRAAASSATDLDAAMRATVLDVWSQLVEADPGMQIMQYELTIWALRTEGMAHVARRQYELYLQVLTDNWNEAAARAGVTLAIPADQLARLFLAGADGLILQYLTLGDPEQTRADLERFVGQMVRHATGS